jgi:hypothetical protein
VNFHERLSSRAIYTPLEFIDVVQSQIREFSTVFAFSCVLRVQPLLLTLESATLAIALE